MIKTIATAALTALIVAVLFSGLVGSNYQPAVGGDTRFPNSTLGAPRLNITGTSTLGSGVTIGSASATTTVNFGKACWTVTTDTGSTSYLYVTGVGTSARLATSTTACG